MDTTNQNPVPSEPAAAPESDKPTGAAPGETHQPETNPWNAKFGDKTPEQVHAAVQAGRDWEKRAKANKKELDTATAELEKLRTHVTDLETATAAAQQEATRTRIATETGLPATLIGHIQGDTEDAMKTSAGLLAEHLTPQTKPTTDPTQGAPAPALNSSDLENAVKRAVGL